MKKISKQLILFINASKKNKLDVFLINKARIIKKISQAGDYKLSACLLSLIEKILRRHKVSPRQLAGIIAVTGPGSFTSLRISVSVANTLAYALQIPIVGIINKNGLAAADDEALVEYGLSKIDKSRVFKYISPFYDRAPNITVAKK